MRKSKATALWTRTRQRPGKEWSDRTTPRERRSTADGTSLSDEGAPSLCVLATSAGLGKQLDDLCEAGVVAAPRGIETTLRERQGVRFLFLLNHTALRVRVPLRGLTRRDLIADAPVRGSVALAPLGARVIELAAKSFLEDPMGQRQTQPVTSIVAIAGLKAPHRPRPGSAFCSAN